MLLIDLAIAEEVLVLQHLLVFGEVLETELCELLMLLGEDVDALLALLDLVVDVPVLLDDFVALLFELHLLVLFYLLGLLQLVVELHELVDVIFIGLFLCFLEVLLLVLLLQDHLGPLLECLLLLLLLNLLEIGLVLLHLLHFKLDLLFHND